ncbi:hypothetical protein UY3_13829 [Chelonia mydas]|uniref:Uncharacterized protein n=1 Tax=Chelonia mydas TaxID=8469 RepID=M7B0X4_CHEMY|nr:hypothetical protein UY3_13829 [Chelonia mydas]
MTEGNDKSSLSSLRCRRNDLSGRAVSSWGSTAAEPGLTWCSVLHGGEAGSRRAARLKRRQPPVLQAAWFRTGQDLCAANQCRWGLRDSPLCSCSTTQPMTHFVKECLLTRFSRGLEELHHATEDAIAWQDDYAHAK